jgi:hypothetical protein
MLLIETGLESGLNGCRSRTNREENAMAANFAYVTIHAIQTGTVRIRANQIEGKGTGPRRLIRTYTGVAWSDWLPIYAWVIEHSEGLIVVDTGETARVNSPGYFPRWHPYFRRGVQERVTPRDEIGPLRSLPWPAHSAR